MESVVHEVVFNGIGYELIKIQKLIGPDSPTLLLAKENEMKLLKKIRDEDRNYYAYPKAQPNHISLMSSFTVPHKEDTSIAPIGSINKLKNNGNGYRK